MGKVSLLLIFPIMFLALPVPFIHADESGLGEFGIKEQKMFKDECLLVAINCGKDFLTLEQKIDRLQSEILKGRAVYTDDELRILREQLDNARKTREFFRNEGASNMYKYPGE